MQVKSNLNALSDSWSRKLFLVLFEWPLKTGLTLYGLLPGKRIRLIIPGNIRRNKGRTLSRPASIEPPFA